MSKCSKKCFQLSIRVEHCILLVDLKLLQKILTTPFLVIKINVQRGSQAHHQMHYQQVLGKRMGRLKLYFLEDASQ